MSGIESSVRRPDGWRVGPWAVRPERGAESPSASTLPRFRSGTSNTTSAGNIGPSRPGSRFWLVSRPHTALGTYSESAKPISTMGRKTDGEDAL